MIIIIIVIIIIIYSLILSNIASNLFKVCTITLAYTWIKVCAIRLNLSFRGKV